MTAFSFPLLLIVGLPTGLFGWFAVGRAIGLSRAGQTVDLTRGIAAPVLIACSCVAAVALSWSLSVHWYPATVVFIVIGMALIATDLVAMRAPFILSGALFATGAIASAILRPEALVQSFVVSCIAYAVLDLARRQFSQRRGYSGIGGGDAAVLAGLVIWVGPILAPWLLIVGPILALLGAMAGVRDGARIPLVPGLVTSAWVLAIASAWAFDQPFWVLELTI